MMGINDVEVESSDVRDGFSSPSHRAPFLAAYGCGGCLCVGVSGGRRRVRIWRPQVRAPRQARPRAAMSEHPQTPGPACDPSRYTDR